MDKDLYSIAEIRQDRQKLLDYLGVLHTDMARLLEAVEALEEDATEEEVDGALSLGIYDVEKSLRLIRELRGKELLF